jgi:hypothetical protein
MGDIRAVCTAPDNSRRAQHASAARRWRSGRAVAELLSRTVVMVAKIVCHVQSSAKGGMHGEQEAW